MKVQCKAKFAGRLCFGYNHEMTWYEVKKVLPTFRSTEMVEKIRPLMDRVLVKRLAHEEKSAGGIIIPDIAKEKAQTGKVIAVGTGRVLNDGTLQPMQVKVGDVVFLPKYAGTEAGGEHIVIKEDEILGIVEQ
jgi:chaperonin GroES